MARNTMTNLRQADLKVTRGLVSASVNRRFDTTLRTRPMEAMTVRTQGGVTAR